MKESRSIEISWKLLAEGDKANLTIGNPESNSIDSEGDSPPQYHHENESWYILTKTEPAIPIFILPNSDIPDSKNTHISCRIVQREDILTLSGRIARISENLLTEAKQMVQSKYPDYIEKVNSGTHNYYQIRATSVTLILDGKTEEPISVNCFSFHRIGQEFETNKVWRKVSISIILSLFIFLIVKVARRSAISKPTEIELNMPRIYKDDAEKSSERKFREMINALSDKNIPDGSDNDSYHDKYSYHDEYDYRMETKPTKTYSSDIIPLYSSNPLTHQTTTNLID